MKYLALMLTITGALQAQLPWPHPPQDREWPLGNAWGSYQNYGSSYVHNGADIMVPALCPAVASRFGYVKKIWLGGSPMYNGVTVADSAGSAFCSGYQYYHIDNSTIRVSEGDTIHVGDTLGLIATWSVAGFHHNHFSKNHNSGTIWPSYGTYFRNPLTEMTPDYDSMMPVFLDAYSGQRFAICRNNTSSYQSRDSVFGDVDLICRLEDKVNHRLWKVAIYKITYTIRDSLGAVVVPLTRSFEMIDSMESYNVTQSRVVYKQDATCNSYCNYDSLNRRYYYIFTNTDGDSLIEATDSLASWNTASVADGPYWVKVIAADEYGNTVADSMLLRVKNNTARHDVGCRAIVAPAGAVDSGMTVTPACSVYNYGTYTESYPVRMKIGADYSHTAQVNSHATGTRIYVTLPAWTALPRGSTVVSCSTELSGDAGPANNRQTGNVNVAVHDIAPMQILAPSGMVPPGPVTPQAVVRNVGTVREPCRASMAVNMIPPYQTYIELPDGLPVGRDTTVTFLDCTVVPGVYLARCSVYLAGDQVRTNDVITAPFEVGSVDVGVVAIRQPAGSIDSSSQVIPRATVGNWSDLTVTFRAFFRIRSTGGDVYTDSSPVADLAPGDTAAVSFAEWPLPHALGEYTTRCSTFIQADENPANDTCSGNFTIIPGTALAEDAASECSPRPALSVAPNPASGVALVRYSLAKPGHATLKLYGITGKLVSVLAKGYCNAGLSTFNFQPSTSGFASGIYLLRLETDGATMTTRLVFE